MKKAKILLYDIETSPIVGFTWVMWEGNVVKVKKDPELLSVAYKYLGEREVFCKTRADFRDKTDRSLCKFLYDLLEDADIVVAHNGISFDNKKSFTRFVFWDFEPLHKLCTIDTKRVAKGVFGFISNSLDDLGRYLGIGRKRKHSGIDLWDRCMEGEKSAFQEMARYNKQDVRLLERVYKRLRKWIPNHPSIALIQGHKGCAICGGTNFMKKGVSATLASIKQRLKCKDCGYPMMIPLKINN